MLNGCMSTLSMLSVCCVDANIVKSSSGNRRNRLTHYAIVQKHADTADEADIHIHIHLMNEYEINDGNRANQFQIEIDQISVYVSDVCMCATLLTCTCLLIISINE